jgi:phosphoglycerate dehydrogenase-like enzyme
MTTVLVVAKPDEPALRVLDPPPPGARLVRGWNAEDFGTALAEAEVLLTCGAGREVLRPLFLAAPRLRWLHALSAGIDYLLFPELVASPVVMTNARGAFSRTLGEWALAAVLFFAKDLRRLVRDQAARRWEPFDVDTVHGRTLGIVGYGDIGRAVAERARAFGLHVFGVRRQAAPTDDLGVTIVGTDRLTDVLSRSDYVVAATPLTPETRGLLSAAAFDAMKADAVFINVGRGPVVDEKALIAALQSGRIRGAALDVFEREPLPPDSPLYALDNVLLSPHCADHTPGWREGSMRLFLDNLTRFEAGQPLRNVVDKSRGY